MGNIHVGTSGFYYKHWKGIFYPEDLKTSDWLRYYSKYFDTVEINSSFYHTVKPSTYESWFKKTPDKFNFCLKGPRYITHIKRLSDSKPSLRIFFDSFSSLGDKTDIILWQFSKSFKANAERLKTFLNELSKINKKQKIRQAFEFRNQSWFNKEVYSLLKKENCAIVSSDSPDFPREEIETAPFAYFRFHGATFLYSSKYSDRELRDWSLKIKKLLKKDKDVYCYFNNDMEAYAVENGRTLKKLLGLF